MTERRDRDRRERERDKIKREEDKRRVDTERRGEQLKEAWRQRHPERGHDKPNRKGGAR